MKHRNGIIKRVMKLPKRVYLAAAVLLFVGGAGTGVSLYANQEPEKVVIEQSASVTPQNEAVEAVVEQETATEPVEQEEAPVEQEVVNPYPEGSNLRLAFEMRHSAGIDTPVLSDGHTDDRGYFSWYLKPYREAGQVPPIMESESWYTPAQYSLVLNIDSSNINIGMFGVMGVITDVNDDGSFTMASIWGDRVVTPENAPYRYINP